MGGVGVEIPDEGILSQEAVLGVGELLAGDESGAVLVRPQLGGHGPPVRRDRRHDHELAHLEFFHILAHRNDLPQALVPQNTAGLETVDLDIVDIRRTRGDQQGTDDPVEPRGLGDRLLDPPGRPVAKIGKGFQHTHGRGPPSA